jgi:short-subunit dehydrogenase
MALFIMLLNRYGLPATDLLFYIKRAASIFSYFVYCAISRRTAKLFQPIKTFTNMTNQNQTVLITGATSGIGLELARLFAADHYNMVLVSRNEERLNYVASELRNMGAGNVIVVPKDLSVPNAAAEIYDITTQQNIHVDVLVNDAGVGEYGYFTETNLEKELAIIQLNTAAMVHLTKLYLREMVGQGNTGKILQLASVASYQPSPLLAVYAATKAFVLSFSDALAFELKDTNITITSLIPNATDTDFFRKAGMEHTKAAQDNPENPTVVAQIGYEALMKGETHAYAPGVRQMVAMSSILTNENVAKMVEKQMQPADQK